jgi:hypothetical protein
MIISELVVEEREVASFDCIRWTGYGELVIQQGERESLTIETHPDLMSKIISEVEHGKLELGRGGNWTDKLNFALETSLTRKPIYYHLTVKELSEIDIRGAGTIRVLGISSDDLFLQASGPNRIQFDSLAAERLEVYLPAGGVVDMDGWVFEQIVAIKGPTLYRAKSLKSDRARVEISGPGEAVVNVRDELNVVIGGLGTVSYIGSPQIHQKISGLGSLSRVGSLSYG